MPLVHGRPAGSHWYAHGQQEEPRRPGLRPATHALWHASVRISHHCVTSNTSPLAVQAGGQTARAALLRCAHRPPASRGATPARYAITTTGGRQRHGGSNKQGVGRRRRSRTRAMRVSASTSTASRRRRAAVARPPGQTRAAGSRSPRRPPARHRRRGGVAEARGGSEGVGRGERRMTATPINCMPVLPTASGRKFL